MTITILGVYFGKFPSCIDLWLKSCGYNKNIRFIVFTDQTIRKKPNNVKVVKMTLEGFEKLASEKLKISRVCLKKPYKLCDFKPVYGIIFEEYLKDCDFWGHCDFDMIFGNIEKLINKKIWQKYDKILPLGHPSFYRNTEEVNNRFKQECKGTELYSKVFTTDKSYAFDEYNGMINIYKNKKYPFYCQKEFADISGMHKRFRLAETPALDKKFDLSSNRVNYKHQVFYWENGGVYRAYYDSKEKRVRVDEFVYIHFKNGKAIECKIKDIKKCDSFYITRDGFIDKTVGTPTLNDIKSFNPGFG